MIEEIGNPQPLKMQRRRWRLWWWGVGIWLILVAGWPVCYLRQDRDWYYPCWGKPYEILTSSRRSENPLYEDERVYSRVFIVRPSEENLACFDWLPFQHCSFSERVESLLKEYCLPGPYRFANTGCVNFVMCGNNLMLVHDLSRNKGGLISSRMSRPEKVLQSYPSAYVFHYVWACVSIVLLVLSPPLFLLGMLIWRIRAISRFRARAGA